MAENCKRGWKNAKVEKKLAKKRKREEEFLANLRKPKDTKVVLADRSLLEKLITKNVTPSSGQPTFLAQDFPALPSGTRSGGKTKKPASYSKAVGNSPSVEESFPAVTAEIKEPIRTVSEITSTQPSPRLNAESKENNQQNQSEELKKCLVSKIPKKKEPIVVKLDDFLIKNKIKKDERDDHSKGRRRGTERGVLYGNMLDSSNLKRRKGKHRQSKKLKLSKFKLAIIRDRIKKVRKSEDETMDEKYFKNELNQYLTDLSEKKLAMAENRRIKQEEKEETVSGEPEEQAAAKKKKRKQKPTKYRKYCDNKYSEELDKSVKTLVEKIVYLQDRAFNKNPIKSKVKQRRVVGLREVKKYLTLKKIKMLILAPDLEAQDSVCVVIEDLKKTAALQNVPCVFALSRRKLGATVKKSVPVSAFGIMNYDGLEDEFKDVKDKLKEVQDLHSSENEPSDEKDEKDEKA